MKSGYYLVMDNGRLFGPIVSDNPKRDTYLDERILKKAQIWGNILKQKVKFIS